MRQVFIALSFVAAHEYVWLELPAWRIYRLLLNLQYTLINSYEVENSFQNNVVSSLVSLTCTVQGYTIKHNEDIWIKMYMDF